MTDNAKKFLEEASKNGALKAEIAKVLSNAEAVAKVAKAHGYDLTAEDFKGLMVQVMSEDELQAVAGGANYNPKLEGINAGQDKDGLMVDFCWDIAMR